MIPAVVWLACSAARHLPAAKQVGKSLPWPSRRRLGQKTCRTYAYVLSSAVSDARMDAAPDGGGEDRWKVVAGRRCVEPATCCVGAATGAIRMAPTKRGPK